MGRLRPALFITLNAIAIHVAEEDKEDAPIQGDLGGVQQMTVINESGLSLRKSFLANFDVSLKYFCEFEVMY